VQGWDEVDFSPTDERDVGRWIRGMRPSIFYLRVSC
jgi:hypothetical protein